MTERSDRFDEGELRGALRPGFPWGDIVILAVTDSTNRVAMEIGCAIACPNWRGSTPT